MKKVLLQTYYKFAGGVTDAGITPSIAEAYYGIESIITTKAFHYFDDTLSAVINAWLDAGKPIGAVIGKTAWKTKDFSKPQTINIRIRITETHYARIRHGLCPEEMEDKWFAYFDTGRLCFHRSWTGAKIYEAQIQKTDFGYEITKINVERDADIYSNTDDKKDIRSFMFLLGRGLLGLNVDVPINSDDKTDVLHEWSDFGIMIFF